MKKLFSLAASLVFVFWCAATVSAWEEISPEDANATVNQDPNAYILDVRTVCEYKFVGHPSVPESKIKNIPYWMFEFDRSTDEYFFYYVDPDLGLIANVYKFFDAAVYRHFAHDDTLIVVCKSGGRAGRAASEIESPSQPASQRLEDLGFANVYRMTGGFSFGWEPAGLPVSTGYEGIWKPSDHKGRSLNKK